MRLFPKAAPVLLVTALLALGAWLLGGLFGELAVRNWRAELDELPAEQAERLARRMAQLGKPGIRALVDALGSDREVTADAARRALWAELERWESLPAPAVTRNLAVLAEALAQNAERFSPAARRDATDLATEVLRWLPESEAVDRLAVIANCDRVFEYAAADRHAAASVAALRSMERTALVQAPAAEKYGRSRERPPLEKPEMPPVIAALPGGGLPIETWPLPGNGPHFGAESTADRRAISETEASVDRQRESGPRLSMPDELFLPERLRPLSPTELFSPAPHPPIPPAPTAKPATIPEDELESGETLEGIETDVLMRWLLAADATVAGRAEAALRRRGFTDVHVELARRLFDADPEVRIQLARNLPKLSSIDPVPWLLWLSRDTDARVRVAVVGLMATTSDPALHARIRQMAREDSDAAVQRIARRLDAR